MKKSEVRKVNRKIKKAMVRKMSKSKLLRHTSSTGPQLINNLDIVFCLDITGSMDYYLNEVLTTMITLIDDFKNRTEVRHIKTRFGSVGYRDHPP